MAHASGVKLNGFDSSSFLDFDCVHIGIDVGFHHRYLDFVLDGIDGGNQGGGLAAARRGHQVKQKHPFLFEFRPELVGLASILLKNAFFDFYDFYFFHKF